MGESQVKVVAEAEGPKRRFVVSFPISSSVVEYADSQSAVLSPIATKLFGFPWTQSVKVGPNYVEVSKQEWIEWSALEEPLVGLITEHFEEQLSRQSKVEENRKPTVASGRDLEADPLAIRVQAVLDEEINPAVAAHGGFIRLVEIKNNSAYLHMGGGCQGCGMKDVTLKQGVMTTLQSRIPELTGVFDITDHSQGSNPYYS